MKQFFILLIVFLVFLHPVRCQKKYQLYTIAFYNLENLFDTIDDPDTADESSPILSIISDRTSQYQKKLSNMANVLSEIATHSSRMSPAIIGVAEIENFGVMEDLVNVKALKKYNYHFIHYDSPDLRGIDVAFLYRPDLFIPITHKTYEVRLWDNIGVRQYTRDILYVSGYLGTELIHVLVNHWPSRRGGTSKSSYRREKAAYVCRTILDQIYLQDPKAKIIIMGDLNDDPYNDSLKEVLETKGDFDMCEEKDLYNPMEVLFKKGQNTLVYRDQLNLFDQILVSNSLLDTAHQFDSLSFFKAGIFRPDYLTVSSGRFQGYPFRSFGPAGFTGGYSDHYPVYIQLVKLKTP